MYQIGEKLEYNDQNVLQRNSINQLPCRLSDDEIVAKSRQAVRLRRELEAAKEIEAVRHAKYKAKHNARLAEIEAIEDAIESGTENRSIPCTMVVVKGVTYIVRDDTNVIAAQRAATPPEAQRVIPGAKLAGEDLMDGGSVDDDDISLDSDEDGDDDLDLDGDLDDDADAKPKTAKRKGKGKNA